MNSPRNAHAKRWVALQDARGIARFRQCLVFGNKVVRETLARHPARCLECLRPATARVPFPIPAHVTTHALPPTLFKTVDLFGTGCPIVVCAAPPLPHADLTIPPRGLELLCPLGDPANVGAVIRTAAAMGIGQVILLQEAAHPYHPRAVRAASGTMFDVRLARGPSVRELPDSAAWVTLHPQGESLPAFQWPEHIRLVVGEEGPGLPWRSTGTRLAIPMAESVESFNAVVAASMAIYAYRVQHPLTSPRA